MTALRAPRPLEADVLDAIRLALGSLPHVVLWRNSVAGVEDGGRHFTAGLPRGSADLIGIVQARNGFGRFFALEVKRDQAEVERWLRSTSRHDVEQRRFLALVNARGGYGVCCGTVEVALAAVHAAAAGALAPALEAA